MSDIEERFIRRQNSHGLAAPGQGGDPDRFDCMVEINPWTPECEALRAMLYRGTIVSAWGFIETNLNETAIRCSHEPAYAGLLDKYPRILGKRLDYLRLVLSTAGPLSPYQSIGEGFLNRFAASAELRNRMAHAKMTLLPNWGVTFTEVRLINGRLYRNVVRHQPGELVGMARQATRLSRLCQRFLDEINTRRLLPIIPAEASVP